MEQEQKKKDVSADVQKQVRKQRAANGCATSKMMSFRIDADNVKYLESVPNKGRTVNDALRRWSTLWGNLPE